MDVVGHDDIAAQQITVAVEVVQRIFHDCQHFGVAKPALANPFIKMPLQLFAILFRNIFRRFTFFQIGRIVCVCRFAQRHIQFFPPAFKNFLGQ